jgi:hypothetical protein
MKTNGAVALFAALALVMSMSSWIVAQERYPSGERYPEAPIGGAITAGGVVTKTIDQNGNYQYDSTGVEQHGGLCASSNALGSPAAIFCDAVEVDGWLYADGGIDIASSTKLESTYVQSKDFLLYNTQPWLEMNPVFDDALHFGIGNGDGFANRHLVITDYANRNKDHDHETLSPDPHVYVHSVTDPDSDNTQWIGIWHDQTNGVLSTGKGVLDLQPAAAGVQLPGIIGTGAPAEPVACTAATARTVVYVDDTDDSAAAQVCICFATGDDGAGTPTMDWRDFADPIGTACSFF